MDKVQHIRLINGEELIGFVTGDNKKEVTVTYPMLVSSFEGSTYLTKYLPYSIDNICSIQRSHVITTTDLPWEIEKYYFLNLKVQARTGGIDKHIEQINYANYMMEQLLISDNLKLSDKAIHLNPGSNTVN